MILFCYITSHFISVVLFDIESFRVVAREYLPLPYEDSDFFKPLSTQKIKALITEKLKMDSVEYDALKKIAVMIHDDDKIEGFSKVYPLRQIEESLSNRILPINLYLNDFAFKKDKKLANKYANYRFYHRPLSDDLLTTVLDQSIANYINACVLSPNSLKEIILSFEENKDLDADSYIMKKIVKLFANNTKINQMYEITFDFGYSIIPIVAALIETKTDPVSFFKENPIHVDYKLVVIPNTDGTIQILSEDLRELDPKKDANELLYVECIDKNLLKIRSKNPKTKLNLEFNGCRYGVYLDLSDKKVNE